MEYHHTTFQGAFDQPSIYRGTPTPELDWQWEEFIEGSAFNLPSDKLHLLNISETDIPRWHHTEPRFGGGVAASGWGFHQIHCLVSSPKGLRTYTDEGVTVECAKANKL